MLVDHGDIETAGEMCEQMLKSTLLSCLNPLDCLLSLTQSVST